uniref:KIAA0825 n=2 Tax=Neogobius melanostomus TaxID=47308 RepID=A0A8C6WXP7_9GOBI
MLRLEGAHTKDDKANVAMELEDSPEDCASLHQSLPGKSSKVDFEKHHEDIEDTPKPNTNSLRQSLKDLQTQIEDLRSESPPNSECLKWFPFRMHFRSVATRYQDQLDFLRALQLYLQSEEDGREVVTLELLVDLSSRCGVCFPRTPSSSHSSTLHQPDLMNTVKDESSVEIQTVWDDVRLQLRRHLLDRLSPHISERPEPDFNSPNPSISERIYCLQHLLFLYPESEVLAYYQAYRGQFTAALLHSAINSSLSGETGFDRLTFGFRSVVPLLTQALNEELYVLSHLVDQHTILGFLNSAYLDSVAHKLASFMERECEAALRDNTTVTSKFRKFSVKSQTSAAPVELSMKSRAFSLTSHQLGTLTQLACTLLEFESSVKELIRKMTYICCSGHPPCNKDILRRKSSLDVTASNRKATITAQSPQQLEVQFLEFDWRLVFKGLVPQMAHCVKVVVDDICTKSLQQEETLYSSGKASAVLISTHEFTTSNHLYSEREMPKMIAQFCGAIMKELNALLPLAAACRDSSLLEVRISFVEACSRAVFAILGRVQERATEVPSSAPLQNLPALVATVIYLHQELQHYHTKLKDSNTVAKVPLTLLPIQKCQDVAETLKEQLTTYCIQVCSTCLLQDAESHQWDDPKPFYEGERCSFSVQMWYYFLCGLRSDLWPVLPPALSKELLGNVLSETLQSLLQRYALARPSYKRHLQIRCDITAVLLYAEELMWSVCESPEALVPFSSSSTSNPKTNSSKWPNCIHNLCNRLLTVLIVVTTPLSTLYRAYINNPGPATQPAESTVVRWLNALDPELFTEQVLDEGLKDQAASACQLRLLTSDPGNDPKMLLRMLLYRDCHLPRMLLQNSYFCQDTVIETSPENHKAGDDFMVALFNILICLNGVPKALTQTLQPYMERAQLWEHLLTLADAPHSAPAVIQCLRERLTKCTSGLLVHLVSMVVNWQAAADAVVEQNKWDVPKCLLAIVPKEWNYTQELKGSDKSLIALVIQALSLVFTCLPQVIEALPLSIWLLFHEAEKHLSQYAQQLCSAGLLIWALLGCFIQSLDNTETPERITGLALNQQAKECLSLLAECLRAAIGVPHKADPQPMIHIVLHTIEEKTPKWINLQLNKAKKLYSDSVFEQEEASGVAVAELTEQKIGLMLLEVCHKAGGSDYLRQIYHIIQGNEELLLSKLSGCLDVDYTGSLVNFAFEQEDHLDMQRFDPLYQFDHLGEKKLNQSALVDWAWDWPRLLPTVQGMSEVTFKTLLANRWEMREDAELDDDEKAMVADLQKVYFVYNRNSGQQDVCEAVQGLGKETQGEALPVDKALPNNWSCC